MKGEKLAPANKNPRTFDRRVFIRGGCLTVSHCPTNVGPRLLPFTGWRHLTPSCISCPAQDKALCDSHLTLWEANSTAKQAMFVSPRGDGLDPTSSSQQRPEKNLLC